MLRYKHIFILFKYTHTNVYSLLPTKLRLARCVYNHILKNCNHKSTKSKEFCILF